MYLKIRYIMFIILILRVFHQIFLYKIISQNAYKYIFISTKLLVILDAHLNN